MARKMNWALTAENLANIGVIDDFFDLYIAIREIYDDQQVQFIEKYGEKRLLWPDNHDELSKKFVRKACEPIMNRYLEMFSDEYDRIFANAHGFATFTFLHTKAFSEANQPGRIEVRYITFAAFLIELQYAICRIIHKWKTNTQPKYAFERVCQEVNHHITAYVESHKVVETVPIGTGEQVTDATLYIFDNLSTTYCRLHDHPISPSKFVAESTESKEKVLFPVHFCSQCEKYFAGRTTIALFEKQYGKLLISKKVLGVDSSFSGFNEESRLHQLGYNVSDGRSDQERQRLLVRLLESDRISYLEMTRSIEQNIHTHPNAPIAIAKWQRDLKYIGEYVLKSK